MYIHVHTTPLYTSPTLYTHTHTHTHTHTGHLVVLAGLVRDAISVDVFVDSSWVSSIAVPPSPTVDKDLGRQVDQGEGVVPQDPDPVAEGRGRSHGPARSTVCMLGGKHSQCV